jgi:hypothetical protein
MSTVSFGPQRGGYPAQSFYFEVVLLCTEGVRLVDLVVCKAENETRHLRILVTLFESSLGSYTKFPKREM